MRLKPSRRGGNETRASGGACGIWRRRVEMYAHRGKRHVLQARAHLKRRARVAAWRETIVTRHA